MVSVTVTIDRADFKRRKAAAIKATAEQFFRLASEAIVTPIWDYPVAPSPRDIVSSGALLRSGCLVAVSNGWQAVWDADGAVAVHEGASLKDGTKLPPRGWTTYALKQMDVDGYFAAAYVNA
jgi:hypothetical protein